MRFSNFLGMLISTAVIVGLTYLLIEHTTFSWISLVVYWFIILFLDAGICFISKNAMKNKVMQAHKKADILKVVGAVSFWMITITAAFVHDVNGLLLNLYIYVAALLILATLIQSGLEMSVKKPHFPKNSK